MGLKERIPERITLRLILRQEHRDDRATLRFRVLSSGNWLESRKGQCPYCLLGFVLKKLLLNLPLFQFVTSSRRCLKSKDETRTFGNRPEPHFFFPQIEIQLQQLEITSD